MWERFTTCFGPKGTSSGNIYIIWERFTTCFGPKGTSSGNIYIGEVYELFLVQREHL